MVSTTAPENKLANNRASDSVSLTLGDDGNDTVSAGPGNDLVVGDGGNDSLGGGDGNDELFGGDGDEDAMRVHVLSFGYKHGLPLDVDIVLDCRFLPNPHWVDELRPHTGQHDAVRDYVLGQP